MSEDNDIQKQSDALQEAEAKGGMAKWGTYFKMSGPGWLQSAITLGGGSLSGSLFLGVLAGFALLWIQPLAMILGIVMLAAISHVTLSTGKHPFKLIKDHFNPLWPGPGSLPLCWPMWFGRCLNTTLV